MRNWHKLLHAWVRTSWMALSPKRNQLQRFLVTRLVNVTVWCKFGFATKTTDQTPTWPSWRLEDTIFIALASLCRSWSATWTVSLPRNRRLSKWWKVWRPKSNKLTIPKSLKLSIAFKSWDVIQQIIDPLQKNIPQFLGQPDALIHKYADEPLWGKLVQPLAQLRLCRQFQASKNNMEKSYAAMAKYLTEMKLDHKDGALESEKLTQLLACSVISL